MFKTVRWWRAIPHEKCRQLCKGRRCSVWNHSRKQSLQFWCLPVFLHIWRVERMGPLLQALQMVQIHSCRTCIAKKSCGVGEQARCMPGGRCSTAADMQHAE